MTPRLLFIMVALALALAGIASVSAQDCVPTQPDGWVVYVIQPDDTLSEIAARSGSTIEALQRANCIENPRRIVAGSRLFVPHEPAPRPEYHFLRRCLNAGYTEQQCRRIWNALHDDSNTFAERCLNAGFTPEECRRIYNDLHDDPTLVERCRAAGLTPEECRRLYNASQDEPGNNLPERCRAAGLTPEECRRLLNASDDDEPERPTRPDVRPEAEPTRAARTTRGG